MQVAHRKFKTMSSRMTVQDRESAMVPLNEASVDTQPNSAPGDCRCAKMRDGSDVLMESERS